MGSADFDDDNDKHSLTFRMWRVVRKNLNFYRVHIIFFTLAPLISAAIFYGSNGQSKIAFIDALFQCISGITGTGLTTIDLSSITIWQQVMLFLLMWFGSPVTVSWVMVYTRRYYFAKKFEHIIESELARRAEKSGLPIQRIKLIFPSLTSRIFAFFQFSWQQAKSKMRSKEKVVGGAEDGEKAVELEQDGISPQSPGSTPKRFRADMIRRIEHEQPRLVDPSGQYSAGSPPNGSASLRRTALANASMETNAPREESTSPSPKRAFTVDHPLPDAEKGPEGILNDPAKGVERSAHGTEDNYGSTPFNRTHTVEFAPSPIIRPTGFEGTSSLRPHDRPSSHMFRTPTLEGNSNSSAYDNGTSPLRGRPSATAGGVSMHRTMSMRSASAHTPPDQRQTRDSGFGGFPTPDEVLARLFRHFFPSFHQRLKRTTSVPTVMSLTPAVSGAMGRTGTLPVMGRTGTMRSTPTTREVPYISFDAVVGRNSEFRMLTSEQLEELGGAEYRALNALLWILPCYQLGIQLFCFAIIAGYMSQNKWKSDFLPPDLHKPVKVPWFALFQSVSAYTNGGMSLVDQSLIPFQTAWLMLLLIPFLILAGNTAFPVFLRLFIWTRAKLCRRRGRLYETLHFLLDHPRRCFIYLFPSHQTWFLVFVLVILNGTDWLSFMVLDIGNDAVDSIPLGTRFLLGLVQATAVRCAGFSTLNLAQLSPAVKVMYVMMMYVGVYPIAVSVRSTNVYEDRSLGIFADEQLEDEEEPGPRSGIPSSKRAIWGQYVGWHIRKQLAFDMWWLGLAVFLVCIVERAELNNPNQYGWFNIFNIIFEVVSAYGNVGLSLGVPYANYSFSGSFSTLSKLIICAVMLRGRHRGLPVAIDRAVMLPSEFTPNPSEHELDPVYRTESRANGPPLEAEVMPESESVQTTARHDHGSEQSRLRHQGGDETV